jgi:hypothetical protein
MGGCRGWDVLCSLVKTGSPRGGKGVAVVAGARKVHALSN